MILRLKYCFFLYYKYFFNIAFKLQVRFHRYYPVSVVYLKLTLGNM